MLYVQCPLFCCAQSAWLTLLSFYSEADQQSFQFYKSGVYDDPGCGEALDHGVAAVGYGTTEDGIDYFKVRNSWVSFELRLVHLSLIVMQPLKLLFLFDVSLLLSLAGSQLGRWRLHRKWSRLLAFARSLLWTGDKPQCLPECFLTESISPLLLPLYVYS